MNPKVQIITITHLAQLLFFIVWNDKKIKKAVLARSVIALLHSFQIKESINDTTPKSTSIIKGAITNLFFFSIISYIVHHMHNG